jgi:bifunctional DNase/RNase
VEPDVVEVNVASLGIDSSTQSPIVILKEKDGERYLPIWIGPSEASAIATELAGVKFSRPLTHDLMKTLVRALHGTLSQVVIGALKNNTYYAQVFVQNGDEDVVAIDARPSDSIALALRLNAPIFASEELLDHTAEDVGQSGEESTTTEYDAEDLKEYLRRMNPEDFGRFTM